MGRRTGEAGGDRWFVAPPEEPAAACCLLSGGEIGQVEDVGTLAAARGQGLAKAVIRAAIAASREAGHRHTFIVADADDWPRLLYEKLGFETCGVLHVLRKAADSGDNRLRPSFVRGYKGALEASLLGSFMLFSRDQDLKSIALGDGRAPSEGHPKR